MSFLKGLCLIRVKCLRSIRLEALRALGSRNFNRWKASGLKLLKA